MNLARTARKLAFAAALGLLPIASFAAVFISVGIAPPALPVYTQPICPGDGYIWTPGYWAYGPEGYFWVPGVWVQPPQVGYLWTPGYWGWGGSAYLWHAGYWGPHVGFYGGVNYGFGYVGSGYQGGYWNGGRFLYNRAVNNINLANVHNVYNRNVINNVTVNRVSYNGGNGGLQVRPSQQEQGWEREQHVPPTANQLTHEQTAHADRGQWASVNGGRPPIAAMARPGDRSNIRPAAGFQGGVNAREQNQQQRIGNGIANGQMAPTEAGRAEQRQANINQQVRQDRQANGGRLNPQERGQVNREQDRASQQIQRENHNQAAPRGEPRQEGGREREGGRDR